MTLTIAVLAVLVVAGGIALGLAASMAANEARRLTAAARRFGELRPAVVAVRDEVRIARIAAARLSRR